VLSIRERERESTLAWQWLIGDFGGREAPQWYLILLVSLRIIIREIREHVLGSGVGRRREDLHTMDGWVYTLYIVAIQKSSKSEALRTSCVSRVDGENGTYRTGRSTWNFDPLAVMAFVLCIDQRTYWYSDALYADQVQMSLYLVSSAAALLAKHRSAHSLWHQLLLTF
jgi:hypothetical protein